MEKLISIIIPIYNVELYLDKCIKSVISQINQWERQIEILLIDDGSTDGSVHICNFYASRYQCVTVIHKKNGGLSDARNCGIRHAHGTYLIFLDSDDALNKNAISEIICTISKRDNADVYIGRYISIYPNKKIECSYYFNKSYVNISKEKLIIKLLNNTSHYDWYAWLNIVRRDFILNNHIFFSCGRYFEDALWTPQLLLLADNVCFFNYPFYLYTRNRIDSITHSFSNVIYKDKLNVCFFFNKFCSENNLKPSTRRLLFGNLNLIYNSLLSDYWKCSKENKKRYWKSLQSFQFIIRYSKRKNEKLLNFLCHVIGLKAVSFLLFLRSNIKDIWN